MCSWAVLEEYATRAGGQPAPVLEASTLAMSSWTFRRVPNSVESQHWESDLSRSVAALRTVSRTQSGKHETARDSLHLQAENTRSESITNPLIKALNSLPLSLLHNLSTYKYPSIISLRAFPTLSSIVGSPPGSRDCHVSLPPITRSQHLRG